MSTEETNIGHLFAPEAPDQVQSPAAPHADPQPMPPDVDYGFNPQQQALPAPQAEVPPPPPPAPQTVPLAELIETRRRAQAAEQERQEIRQQNQQLMEALSRLTRPQQPEPQPIDPIADPEAAFAALQHRQQQDLLTVRLDMSESFARQRFGDQAVEEALAAAHAAGINRHFAQHKDAYGEMMRWHQGQRLASEIGNDPAAYEARIRAKVIAEMQAGRAAPPNLPPSLSTATKANGAPEVVGSDKDFFRQTMNPRRG